MDPKCRSSKILIECLFKMEISFRDYDILKDDSLKEWLKHYSNWPSFPQIYINKKFIGGTEIILQLVEKDEFMQLVPSECIKANALEKTSQAMKRSPVVLFMKGTPEDPVDAYQARAVQYLKEFKIRYSWFDVMTDPDVRELLKENSRFNSFPQLFIEGKFAGGLYFIEDGVKTGKITDSVPATEIMLDPREKIYRLMKKGVYMTFMRGTPNYP